MCGNAMIFKKYRADINGNVAIMFSVSLLAFVAIIGAAIDFSKLVSTKSKLQNLSDALTLAAVVGLQNGELEEAGLDDFATIFLEHNGVDYKTLWSRNGDELNLTLSTEHDLILMGAFGHEDKNISVSTSVPVFETNNFNLALVLDTTLTMQGTRITSLRRAANEMIDVIRDTGTNDTYVSVVPFTKLVKIPVAYEDETWFNRPDDRTVDLDVLDEDQSINCRTEFTSTEFRERVCDVSVFTVVPTPLEWTGCMISRESGLHTVPDFEGQLLQGLTRNNYCSRDQNTMTPMTNNMDTISAAIDDMIPHGQTYIPAGLIWGWRTLRPQAPLIEVAQAPPQNKKVMIVMTDGANSRSLSPPASSSDGLRHDETANNAAADLLTSELCESIKDDDIEIFTIALEITDVDTITRMETCASSPGHFYDVSNSSSLSAVFESITTELEDIRLSN